MSTSNTIGNSQLFDNGTNIVINTIFPIGKLPIKGSADVSQLVIDANSVQSNNANPLIKLRSSSGAALMSIHYDNSTNSWLGFSAGKVNNANAGAIFLYIYWRQCRHLKQPGI